MTPADVVLWLGKLLGGEAIKRALAGRGLQAELRVFKKALDDSQQRRAELEDVVRIAEGFAAQRDAYFEEIVRLRAENVALRAELVRLRVRIWPRGLGIVGGCRKMLFSYRRGGVG